MLVFKLLKPPTEKGELVNQIFFPQLGYLHTRFNAEAKDFYLKFWQRAALD